MRPPRQPVEHVRQVGLAGLERRGWGGEAVQQRTVPGHGVQRLLDELAKPCPGVLGKRQALGESRPVSQIVRQRCLDQILLGGEVPVQGRHSEVFDTTVPGAPKNAIHWDDLQLTRDFTWRAANLQTRRMGFLSALHIGDEHVRYVLYNPGFVRTSHQGALSRPARAFVSLLAKTLGTPPGKAIEPMVALIADPPDEPLGMYARHKKLPLTIDDDDRVEADRLREALTQCG